MQADQEPRRKLAAILSADVAGYSRLMGEDEAATVAMLNACREVFAQLIARHQGRVVDTAGDSVLAMFDSVVEAVHCAAEVQQALSARNAELPAARRMQFRVGVNLGDVIEQADGSIYGDGVNIGARLQALADPGGICISGTAYDQIKNKLPLAFDSLGTKSVKNIPEPVRVYRVRSALQDSAQRMRPGGVAMPHVSRKWILAVTAAVVVAITGAVGVWNYASRDGSPPTQVTARPAPALPLPDKPSIAVLPFVNMSGDKEQEYFSDGMTEDVITSLSKRSGLFVIARNSVFGYKGRSVKPEQVSRELGVRYVLEGSVRKAENRVRITAQLIDATTGYHLWAENYDGELKDIFALQDRITQKIVTALAPKLAVEVQSRPAHQETNSVEAYDLVLRAVPLINEVRKEPMAMAHRMLQKAIALDPNYGRAYTMLSWVYVNDWWFQWTQDHARGLDRALEAARRGVELDESSSDAHLPLGWALLWRKQHDLALAEMEKAVSLDSNNYDAYAMYAEVLNFCGRPGEAIDAFKKAMRLNPNFPFYVQFFLGNSYWLLRRYDEAIAAYQDAALRNPEHPGLHGQLALAYLESGREKEARAEAAEAKRLDPGMTLDRLRDRLPYRNRADLDRLLSGLRKLGMK